MYIIFDTETTGLPKRWDAPISDTDNWPRCIQIAWQLHDENGQLVEHQDFLVQPDGFDIPFDSERIHGISTELAQQEGVPLSDMLEQFESALSKARFVVGHNVGFDLNILGAEYYRLGQENPLAALPVLDTCTEKTAELVQLPGGRGGRFKLPKLGELHAYLFGVEFKEAHNATADVEATTRCFFELIRTGAYTASELGVEESALNAFRQEQVEVIKPIGLKHINLRAASEKIRKKLEDSGVINSGPNDAQIRENLKILEDHAFAHLHNHTQFSILQSTISIPELVKATAAHGMSAVAMTDHANMMGAFHFVNQVLNHNAAVEKRNQELLATEEFPVLEPKITPIVGCEFHVCMDHLDRTHKDNGYQVVFLAKNKKGYHNLVKMASIAYTAGFYYVPRIDRKIIEQYKEDLIVLSGNLQGEIPNKILRIGENQAEEALLWWKDQFGEDFYIELMRHGQEDENRVNPSLIQLARKHDVKLIATNNTYYLQKADAYAQDILLCVKDAEKIATPIGTNRGERFGLPNNEYYFKSPQEMKELFADVPEAIMNIQEILDKVEIYSLRRDVLLPQFEIPDDFRSEEDLIDGGKRGENNYLRHLTFEGAKRRYEVVTEAIRERLDFELATIEKTGYPGYFLIVQDLIAEARRMGVAVGPGRGSAAGSAVAYCLQITNIDPIKYDLLFERFLNPDRISMPDIDIDFDDVGRSKVMDYVINKYGANQVAQIITYGTMAAKSAIKDTARVLDLPLYESEKISKLVPNMKLNKIFNSDDKTLKSALRSDEWENVQALKAISNGKGLEAKTLQEAQKLEGSLRNTGIHACGVIITPDDITNFVPVATAKDSDLYVTQFDNAVVESAGLLKMDFLGLKTLTLIKDTIQIIKDRHGIAIDPDLIPLDDAATYSLFQRGETVGIFQYESDGMQKHLKDLKPTVFEDLIAMNALYRPGPMDYIPSFIKRKQGLEPITYDLEACEEHLKETYGITVYQEQVMLLSQKLANFSKGDADILRKAMGKKQRDVLDEMKPQFLEQGMVNGHDEKILNKIWTDWEAFASYAFNKSHSTCYAWIAYQTAYLKANYPAEFMAAVLSNNMNNISSVTFFMEESKRMGIEVKGPDVNESEYKFTVTNDRVIRFGMGAVKGVGAGAVETIVQSRKNEPYRSIFDLAKRIDLRAANKRALESLAYAGGFDSFEGTHRAQYFHQEMDGITLLEKALRYGAKYKENENSAQASLFGGTSEVQMPEPTLPECPEWGLIEKLKYEKDVIGIYLTSHPLDTYRFEIDHFCMHPVRALKLMDKVMSGDKSEEILTEFKRFANRDLVIGGMITSVDHRTNKNGKPFGRFVLEDYGDSQEIAVFGDDYVKVKSYLTQGYFVQVKGKIHERFRQPNNWGFSVTSIQLLSELRDKYAKSLTLQIPLQALTAEMHEKIRQMVANNEDSMGTKNCQLKFRIYDMEEEYSIDLPSKSVRIYPDDAFIASLRNLEGISYRLN
ncbi:MAG TPA: DNA polymerase III subunit alpha [Sphingobacteriaceae bacterium]|nr:DNA polymerase III subunit alpha [Sphingobacteriaceae bacterium]